MELTEDQIKFLDKVCKGVWTLNSNGEVDVDGDVYMTNIDLTEIPVKFGKVSGRFDCSNNQLTSLEFAPTSVGSSFYCHNNQLTKYFKNIKEEDFQHWEELDWSNILFEYPFLVNIGKKYIHKFFLKKHLNNSPLTKLYLE